jgi:3-oxoacyl-[acyl-carrier protein] reductase
MFAAGAGLLDAATRLIVKREKMSVVLLTNVTQYAAPGALTALVEDGHDVVCHDASFIDEAKRETFESRRGRAKALAAQSPEQIYAEAMQKFGLPAAIILNDVYPIARNAIESIPVADLRETFEAVVLTPIRLAQLFLPAMKERGRGAFVFVTSARPSRPEPGFAVPTTLRAATTSFARALAVEAAPFGIQSNVVAPNYLYSEMYYPKARFVDDAAGREAIAKIVPFGRLGEPAEVGALIAFFASGKSPFTTGQVVQFSGGWS